MIDGSMEIRFPSLGSLGPLDLLVKPELKPLRIKSATRLYQQSYWNPGAVTSKSASITDVSLFHLILSLTDALLIPKDLMVLTVFSYYV